MRVSRVYYSPNIEPQQSFEVDGKVHHYLSRVLHLKVGQQVRFFDGKGLEFLCTMTQCERHRSTFACEAKMDVLSEPKLKIQLYLAVCKNDAMDFAVQKATELGVSELRPLICERSLAHKIADSRRSHWQGVATSACEQCGRAIIPKVAKPIALQEVAEIHAPDKAIICSFETQTSIKECFDKLMSEPFEQEAIFHLMIGPEGGFSTDEVAHAVSIGFEIAHLGDYALRCETAAIAALSVLRLGSNQ